MVNADRYQHYADECRALAGQLSSEHHRRTLLDIAEEWENLAQARPQRTAANEASTAQRLRSAFQARG